MNRTNIQNIFANLLFSIQYFMFSQPINNDLFRIESFSTKPFIWSISIENTHSTTIFEWSEFFSSFFLIWNCPPAFVDLSRRYHSKWQLQLANANLSRMINERKRNVWQAEFRCAITGLTIHTTTFTDDHLVNFCFVCLFAKSSPLTTGPKKA